MNIGVLLIIILFSELTANPLDELNIEFLKCGCKTEKEPGLGWAKRFNSSLSQRLTCTMSFQNKSDRIILNVKGLISLQTKNGYELSSMELDSPNDFYRKNSIITLTGHSGFEERYDHAECIVKKTTETKIAQSIATEIKEKFKFQKCFCEKKKLPLSGILNSLEPDSGYELICKARLKNETDKLYNKALVKFNLLTKNGYPFGIHEIWTAVDNFAPGKSIDLKTTIGSIPFSRQYDRAFCNVTHIE